jgi:hypothetical protein
MLVVFICVYSRSSDRLCLNDLGVINHYSSPEVKQMSTLTIDDIFNCQLKLTQHDQQSRKHYNDNASPAMLREAIMKLVQTGGKVTQAQSTADEHSFKESFALALGSGGQINVGMSSRKPTCIKTCTIRNPSTYDHYNKLVSYIHSILDETHAKRIISFLDTFIGLTRKGYVFECYIEPLYMSLRLESTRTKLNVDVDIDLT